MTRGARGARGVLRRAADTYVSMGPAAARAVLADSFRAEAARRAEKRRRVRHTVARGPGCLLSAAPLREARSERPGRRTVGASFCFAEAELEVRFLAPDMVRISWGPDEPPVPWALEDPDGDPPVGAGVLGGAPARITGDPATGFLVRAASLSVRVRPDGALEYLDRSGRLVRREPPPIRRGTARTARVVLRQGERIAGLGEQAGGVFLSGVHRLWNRDPSGWGPGTGPLYCVIPVLVGVHPDGDTLSFYENTHDGTVRIFDYTVMRRGTVEVSFSAGMLRHYVASGPLPRLLGRYAELTGRPPLPPRWALGYHQSRWGYRTRADVEAISDGFAQEGLPVSAIHLDIDHMDGFRVFTVDEDRFPDLAGLTARIAGRGTRLVTIVDPAAFPDFTDPGTRRWWGGDHRECHNAYGLLMDRAGAEALRTGRPGTRPFVLSRSGWAGVQRWAWNWTGDCETSWAGLAQQVPTAIGLGLSGVAFCGSDTGGFLGEPSPELYVRWLELSVFMPLCRTHSVATVPGREPWRFPEPYRAAIGRLIRFRYRLLPYLYTLAADASQTGHPLVRPPWWPSAPEPPEPTNDDAFLLGDGLFVAPVLSDGARVRRLSLPPGAWVRWRPLQAAGRDGVTAGSAERVKAGDGGAVVDAPLGTPPVLVRAGTILPVDDGFHDGRLDPDHAPRLLAFHCFADRTGRARGWAYDDAGDGGGEWRADRLELVPGAGGLRTLRWARRGGMAAPERVRVVVHGRPAVLARADGSQVAVRAEDGAAVVECEPFEVLELS